MTFGSWKFESSPGHHCRSQLTAKETAIARQAKAPDALHLHPGDLPAGLDFGGAVAIDTETTGLSLTRDRLCLAQLSAGNNECHLVQFAETADAPVPFPAPNFAALLADESVTKLYHFARFDVAVLERFVGPVRGPVYCTKIASKLTRTYSDRHGLKDLCRELLNVEISKEQQSSDWGAAALSDDQLNYAAQDVLYLHRLRERLDQMLARKGRTELAAACFAFVPVRARLDLAGWPDVDIFAH